MKCKYCNKEFLNKSQLGGHVSNCKFNPNAKIRSNNLKETIKKKWKIFKVKCYKCDKEFNISEYNVNKPKKDKYFCSRSCANSRGKRTEDFKQKVSEKLKKEKQIFSNKCIICKCLFTTTMKNKKTCSEKCLSHYRIQFNKNRIFKKETKIKLSKSIKELYKNGKKVQGGKVKWYNYKNIKVQGTYELKTCEILDEWKNQNLIKDWEYTNDRFEYLNENGNKHMYLVDFKIFENDGTFYYLEIKGYETPNDKLKWQSVIDSGFKLIVWFKDDIFNK